MTESTPIACSLSPDGMADREQEFRELALAALIDAQRDPGILTLRFESTDGTEARLCDLVRREQECCPFFDFRVEQVDGSLRLEVRAPLEADELLEAIDRAASAR